jgi:hypothetical protein
VYFILLAWRRRSKFITSCQIKDIAPTSCNDRISFLLLLYLMQRDGKRKIVTASQASNICWNKNTNKSMQFVLCIYITGLKTTLWFRNVLPIKDITLACCDDSNLLYTLNISRVRSGAVGWGTALQAGSRFPIVSLEFFIDTILPVALWPWGWLSL